MVADGHCASKRTAARCPRAETNSRAKAPYHTTESVLLVEALAGDSQLSGGNRVAALVGVERASTLPS